MSVAGVPGMRNFFGKKLGSWVFQSAAQLSPVDITKGAVRSRINAAYAGEGLPGAGKVIRDNVMGALKNKGNYTFGDWFTGLNIGENTGNLAANLRRQRMAVRMGLPVAAGIAGVSSMVAPGNPLDTVARTGLQVGAHTTATALLGSANPLLGAAYAGWSTLNLVRPKNQIGPF